MPRPLKQRKRPPPDDVRVRKGDAEEVVPADEFAERRREAQWARWREAYTATPPVAI